MSDLVNRLRTACSPESPLGKLCAEAADELVSAGWWDISFAPLDGTEVDLWAVRGELGLKGISPGRRYPNCRFARRSYGTEPFGEPTWLGLDDQYITVTPTHWRPVPSAPHSQAPSDTPVTETV